jgi:hypothetical protein
MKLNRSTIVLPLAGLLIVAGAGAVMATSGPAPAATDTTIVPAAESAPPATDPTTMRPRDTALTDVLDDLVANGTINESQKQAILDGVAAERTARRAERQADREQVRTFLADGVITQGEFDQLPAESRIRELDELMADGSITIEELQALRRGFGGGRGGHGDGWKMGPGDPAPDASAAPESSS